MTHTVIHPSHTAVGPAIALYTLRTGRFKTARLTVSLTVPAKETDAMQNTLLFGVLRRGTVDYPTLSDLNRRLDELYGTTLTVRNYLYGDRQVMGLTAEFLENEFLQQADRGHMDLLGDIMQIMAQMLLHPLMDGDGFLRKTAVEQEKISLADTLRAERNDPRAYAANRLRRIMCQGQPYGISLGGELTWIPSVTASALTARYHDWVQHMTCTICYVGRATEQAVNAAWRTAFDQWNPNPVVSISTQLHPLPGSPRRVEEALPIGQARLCMGWACGVGIGSAPLAQDDDYPAMLVLNELLGVMQDAKLFRYVREELGLCYECESAYDSAKGIFTVTCGIHPSRRDEAEQAILRVISDVQNGCVTEEEVATARTSLLIGYRQIPDSPASMEAYWMGCVLSGVGDPPETMMERVSAVSMADVIRVSNRLVPDTVYFLTSSDPITMEEDSE